MAFDTLDVGTLDVFNPLLGSAVELPKGFWKPGTGAIYNAYLGKTSILGFGQGTVCIGMNPDSPLAIYGAPGNVNLHNTSITKYIGDHQVVGRSSVNGIEFRTSVANVQIKGMSCALLGKEVDVVGKTTNIAGANINIGAPNITIGGRNWYASTVLWDSKKSFDIPHPSKNNHRLRYICLEGPKADVFVRGKLSSQNVIELPEYWKDLVDEESITVTLTPIGNYQELYVEKIVDGNKIHIKSERAMKINCHYSVYGERKDTTKNISEYEGLSSNDYPGDNREYVINGGKN
jgi:hypothetical protein